MSGKGEMFDGRFEIEERIGAGGMGEVFQAFDRERNQRVALKTLSQADAKSIYRFKREFRALANVVHPNLVTLYDLVASGDEWFFTMEFVRGVDFLSYVRGDEGQSDKPSLPSTEILQAGTLEKEAQSRLAREAVEKTDPTITMAVVQSAGRSSAYKKGVASKAQWELLQAALTQLAMAISALHERGHLHRDIKPANILVTAEGRVVVLDFGVITDFVGNVSSADDVVAGTPAYMAPELVGAEAPSPASDWYALGVILYEALTGRRPFDGGPSSVMRAKIRSEISLEYLLDCGGPRHLVGLCIDLLRRAPESRPSGEDVHRRLADDGPPRELQIAPVVPYAAASTLVGRANELETLRDVWQESRERNCAVSIFLHGVSGSGKSVLVERFLEELERDTETLVLAGRCYEQESVPYKALDSLIDSITRYLLPLKEHDLRTLLPNDVQALESAFPVLGRVEVIASMAAAREIIGDAAELQRRAFAALSDLIESIAGSRRLVIYIDDLQWGDVESVGFLSRLLGPLGPQMLFVAGYRSEQFDSSELLPALFASIEAEEESSVRTLEVGPLSEDLLESLAIKLFQARSADSLVEGQARSIAVEAAGNPYFVHELVHYAVSHPGEATLGEVLHLSAAIGARASQLSPAALRLLRVVCVAGWRMTVGVAQKAASLTWQDRQAFMELKASHFVRSTGTREHDTIEPYHDHVRDTLTSGLDQESYRGVHLAIAKALESLEGNSESHIYALAHHWYQASPPDCLARVLEVNLRAGAMANESFAFAQAMTYFDHATATARLLSISLPAETEMLIANVAARAGRSEEALARYAGVLDGATDPMERARLRRGAALIHLGRLDTKETIATLGEALAELGMRPAGNVLSQWATAAYALVRGTIALKLRSPLDSNSDDYRRHVLLSNLYRQLSVACYYDLNPERMLRSTMRMLQSAARLGPSRELAEWYILVSGTAASMHRKEAALKALARGRELLASVDDRTTAARTRLYSGIFESLIGDPVEAEISICTALDDVGPLLESIDYYSGASCVAWNRLLRGDAAGGLAMIDQTLKYEVADGYLDPEHGHSYRYMRGPLLAMLGQGEQAVDHMESVHCSTDVRWHTAQHLAHTILVRSEVREVGTSFDELVDEFWAMRLNPKRIPPFMRHGFIGIAYGQRQQVEGSEGKERAKRLADLRRTLSVVKASSKGVSILSAHAAVLQASYENFLGFESRAVKYLSKATALADETTSPWVHYEVAVEKAGYHARRAESAMHSRYLDKAIAMAESCGWSARREYCERLRADG